MMMKIRVSPAALNDLKEINFYIKDDLSNPIAEKNVMKRIVDDYNRLTFSPDIGIPLSTKVPFETDYRFIISGNYLIFYKTDNEYVSVYRVLYGRRDYLRIIFDDKKFDDKQ